MPFDLLVSNLSYYEPNNAERNGVSFTVNPRQVILSPKTSWWSILYVGLGGREGSMLYGEGWGEERGGG